MSRGDCRMATGMLKSLDLSRATAAVTVTVTCAVRGPRRRRVLQRKMTEYSLWWGGYENKYKFYINSRDVRWKIAASIKHPKTLTDTEPEAIILFNAFPKRPPPVEAMPLSSDWRSIRPPYRSELRRLARIVQDNSDGEQSEQQVEVLRSTQTTRLADNIDLSKLLRQLRRSHTELLRAIEMHNARAQSRHQPTSSLLRADADTLAAEVGRLQAVRDRLEVEVRAARAAIQ